MKIVEPKTPYHKPSDYQDIDTISSFSLDPSSKGNKIVKHLTLQST
jgi:hypothetical protein